MNYSESHKTRRKAGLPAFRHLLFGVSAFPFFEITAVILAKYADLCRRLDQTVVLMVFEGGGIHSGRGIWRKSNRIGFVGAIGAYADANLYIGSGDATLKVCNIGKAAALGDGDRLRLKFHMVYDRAQSGPLIHCVLKIGV